MASRQVPQHIKLKEYNRIRALRRKYGRVPDGQGQFTYDGKVYKVKLIMQTLPVFKLNKLRLTRLLTQHVVVSGSNLMIM